MLDRFIERVRSGDGTPLYYSDVPTAYERITLMLLSVVYRYSHDPDDQRVARVAEEAGINYPYTPLNPSDVGWQHLHEGVVALYLADGRKAAEHLYHALSLETEFQTSAAVADFASLVLHLPPQEAVAELLNPDNKGAFDLADGARWWREQSRRRQRLTWTRVYAVLALFLVVAVLYYVVTLVQGVRESQLEETYVGINTTFMIVSGVSAHDTVIDGDRLLLLVPPVLAIIDGIFLLFHAYIYHTVASIMRPTHARLIDFAGSFVWLNVLTLILRTLFNGFMLSQIPAVTSPGAYELAMRSLGSLYQPFAIVLIAFQLGALFWLVQDVYEHQAIWTVAIFVVAGGLVWISILFQSMIATALVGLLRGLFL